MIKRSDQNFDQKLKNVKKVLNKKITDDSKDLLE